MNRSILANKNIQLFFQAWWFVWAVMQYIILSQLNIDVGLAIADSLFSTVLLGSVCYFISNNMRYYLPGREKYWYLLIVSAVGTLLYILIHRGLFGLVISDKDPYIRMIKDTWQIRAVAAFLLISSMSMFSLLWYSQEEQKEINARKTEIEKLNKEAELFKLRQQLQPHFLFNSLNSISALTLSNPEKSREMIHQLSDFLRGTLKRDDQQWNTLEEELQHLELYLEIEKVRFGNRLNTRISASSLTRECKIPALLLQPVVENAIKFGLYDTTGTVLIELEVESVENNLLILVKNPYDPETAEPVRGAGFGLSSIQRRLFLLFARNDLLKTKKEDHQFITTILIPQII